MQRTSTLVYMYINFTVSHYFKRSLCFMFICFHSKSPLPPLPTPLWPLLLEYRKRKNCSKSMLLYWFFLIKAHIFFKQSFIQSVIRVWAIYWCPFSYPPHPRGVHGIILNCNILFICNLLYRILRHFLLEFLFNLKDL